MLHRIQKLGIGPGKTGQLLGIELVGLTLVGVDQPCLAGVGHQHLVTALLEQAAHPGRVGSDLYGDLELPFGVEAPPESLRGGAQPALFYDLAASGVDEAEVAVFVAEIQSGRNLWLLAATIHF
jgi:hypothetical protein